MNIPDLINSVPDPVRNPTTPEDATANLRHTIAVYEHPDSGGPPADTYYVVTATRNIYGDKVTTGLTWADLRLIDEALHRIEGVKK